MFRAQLRDKIQRSGGLQQWALEIEKLVRKSNPGADTKMVDTNIVQAFVDGIKDLEVSAAVRLRHHTSLKEALAHALEVESVRHNTIKFQPFWTRSF
ncbi:hypothetical protein RR48_02492 [Papilio machaon]|uniref:Uncharacterized protein n=1 Tax=Papilio machaon TaxID=76193 RepID=A0A0N1INM5_PAPMA|nr:hypothetical protein RR48_02492 [Papilio machaon]